MRTPLLLSGAVAAVLVGGAPGFAQDAAVTADPLADADSTLATPTDADAIMKGSEGEQWLTNAVVTTDAGEVLGTVAAIRHGADEHLEALVIEATDGAWYDLPAESVTLDAEAGTVTTTAVLAELERRQSPIEEIGDVDDPEYDELD